MARCFLFKLTLLLYVCSSYCDFIINARTVQGNVVKEAIRDYSSQSYITLEYTDWDATKITQIIDFKSGFSIYNIILLGEMDAGQPPFQSLCFVNHISRSDFIEPESVSKLRQKNQDAIRTSETHLGALLSSIDLVINLSESDLISPHIKTYCETTNGAIYSTKYDFMKAVQEYNRDYNQMISATQSLSTYELPRCHRISSSQQACVCYFQFAIDWYPCSIRMCRDEAKHVDYKCGIKTCGVTRRYEFAVDSNVRCWWEWFNPLIFEG